MASQMDSVLEAGIPGTVSFFNCCDSLYMKRAGHSEACDWSVASLLEAYKKMCEYEKQKLDELDEFASGLQPPQQRRKPMIYEEMAV